MGVAAAKPRTSAGVAVVANRRKARFEISNTIQILYPPTASRCQLFTATARAIQPPEKRFADENDSDSTRAAAYVMGETESVRILLYTFCVLKHTKRTDEICCAAIALEVAGSHKPCGTVSAAAAKACNFRG